MIDQRSAWRDYICSPEHAGRHLVGLGSSVVSSIGEAIDKASIAAFLNKLDHGTEDVLFLSNTVDLISGGYIDFLERQLPHLLDTLAADIHHQDEVIGPALHGNARWDRTILGRSSGRLPVGRYIARTRYRSYDLPENLLIRWLVSDLMQAIVDIRRRTRGNRLHDVLERIDRSCFQTVGHHWLRGIPAALRLDPAMTVAARRRRRPEYARAAYLADRRWQYAVPDEQARWEAVLDLLRVGWLEPIKLDDLFELYSLVRVMDVIGNELGFGDPDEFGLVLPGRSHVAAYERAIGTIKVYFDQTAASVLGIATRYKAVIKAHEGLNGTERRPDILVTFERPNATRKVLLIEMKKSDDGTYLSDSVYKVFGYLHDFQAAWSPDQKTRALLLVPDTVSSTSRDELVVAGADDVNTIAATIRTFLSAA